MSSLSYCDSASYISTGSRLDARLAREERNAELWRDRVGTARSHREHVYRRSQQIARSKIERAAASGGDIANEQRTEDAYWRHQKVLLHAAECYSQKNAERAEAHRQAAVKVEQRRQHQSSLIQNDYEVRDTRRRSVDRSLYLDASSRTLEKEFHRKVVLDRSRAIEQRRLQEKSYTTEMNRARSAAVLDRKHAAWQEKITERRQRESVARARVAAADERRRNREECWLDHFEETLAIGDHVAQHNKTHGRLIF